MEEKVRSIIRSEVDSYRKSVLYGLDNCTINDIKIDIYLYSSIFEDAEFAFRDKFDAWDHSSRETKFGKVTENVSREYARLHYTLHDYVPMLRGIDIVFSRYIYVFIISCKNGENWANSGDPSYQKQCFIDAKNEISKKDMNHELVSVMAISSGNSLTKVNCCADIYLAGKRWWYFLTGDPDFDRDLMEEFNRGSEDFQSLFLKKKKEAYNRLLKDFRNEYKNAQSIFQDNILAEDRSRLGVWNNILIKNSRSLSYDPFLDKYLRM